MKSKRKQEKLLKKSMRERKRYLLIEKAEKAKVEKAILDYIGILGYSKASPVWIENNVLAVNRKEVEKIKAGLELASIQVRKISGTLRGLNI